MLVDLESLLVDQSEGDQALGQSSSDLAYRDVGA